MLQEITALSEYSSKYKGRLCFFPQLRRNVNPNSKIQADERANDTPVFVDL